MFMYLGWDVMIVVLEYEASVTGREKERGGGGQVHMSTVSDKCV